MDTNKVNCCGCSACIQACPQHCISFYADEEGFFYPNVEENLCIKCGSCKKVCPFLADEPLRKFVPEAYGAKSLDIDILEHSSSGGLFSVFAERIIKDGGVVYGAAMKKNMKSVHHMRISSSEELVLLRGSKYMQSDMGDCLQRVKEDLISGKEVLFSGVPCQIDGLKMYLNKKYDNLICIEVICHGVPSSLLWKRYVETLEQRYNAAVISVNFRKKKHSWNNFGLGIEGSSISQYKSLEKDSYLQMFLKNYCLRPSCYDCNAKKLESMADLSVGDFWGVERIIPTLNDDKGTSLVLIQTDKGKTLFESVEHMVVFQKVDFEKAISGNPAYYRSANKPEERDLFYTVLNSYGYRAVARKYGHLTAKEAVISMLKKTHLLNLFIKLRGGVTSADKRSLQYGLYLTMKIKTME